MASTDSTAAAPAGNTGAAADVYIALSPLSYDGAVPRPSAACTDPTPDEQIKTALREREAAIKEREEQQQYARTAAAAESNNNSNAAAAAAAADGVEGTGHVPELPSVQQLRDGAAGAVEGFRSLMSQLSLSMEKATTDVTARAHTQARALDQQQSYSRFSSFFGDTLVRGEGEVLLADYSCCAMHNGAKVSGHLFITKNYICFAASFASIFATAADAVKNAVNQARQQQQQGEGEGSGSSNSDGAAAPPTRIAGIKQVIPLRNIASLVKAIALPTVGNGAPYFLPSPADYVVANALQVYDAEGKKLYQFLDFDSVVSRAGTALSTILKGTPLDRAYNYVDHAWREAVTVPVAGVQYAAE